MADLMKNASPRHVCSFCGLDVAEVRLLFRSHIGGLPPEICSACVELFADIVGIHKRSPERAAAAIEVYNQSADKFARRG